MGMSTLFRLAIAGLVCAFACPRPTQGVVVLNALTTYQQDFNFLDNANTSVIWQNDQTTETTTGSPGWFWQNHPSSARALTTCQCEKYEWDLSRIRFGNTSSPGIALFPDGLTQARQGGPGYCCTTHPHQVVFMRQ